MLLRSVPMLLRRSPLPRRCATRNRNTWRRLSYSQPMPKKKKTSKKPKRRKKLPPHFTTKGIPWPKPKPLIIVLR